MMNAEQLQNEPPKQDLNPQEEMPTNEQTPKKSQNKLLWIIIAVVVVAALAVGGWFAYSRLYKKNNSANQQTAVQPNIQTAEVSITATGFNPATVKIKKGDQVMWKNTDTKLHRIFAEPYPTKSSLPDLDSEALQPGSSYGFIFEQAGTYKYTDYNNPTKFLGTVVVE